jgi:HAD superfamily hydrolase (TIGR01490 family)
LVRAIAVFDLDGTITRHDTLVPYLLYALRRHPVRLWRLWVVPAALLRFAITRDRGVLKSELIRAVLGGWTRAQINRLGVAYLDQHLPPLIRAGALRAIERHRQAGDYLVLLSASVDLYVPMIGARLGFNETTCTEIAWHHERLSGQLTSANRHGAEKTEVIRALRTRYPLATIAAYGNAHSDLHHLGIVEHPTVVNASLGTRKAAQALGFPLDRWP